MAGQEVSAHTLALLALGVALCGVGTRPAWRLGRLVVTPLHEIGHAFAAVLMGRKVTAIHLRADASGLTFHLGSARRTGRLVTALAGYPAPGLVAMSGAWLSAHGHPAAWLVTLAVLGAIAALLWVRNLFGLVLLAASTGALLWLLSAGAHGAEIAIGLVLVWYLALGGLRSAAALLSRSGPSDATDVARLTRLPVGLCKVGFVATTAAAVAACGGLLFGWP